MIKLMTTIYKNPVGKTFLGLIFAFIFGVSALSLSIFSSDQLGKVDVPYQVKETYKFDQWTLNYDFLTLDFPDGGFIIPGYQNDRIASMLIIANGTITIEASDTFKSNSDIDFPLTDEVSEVVIPLHHEDFDKLKRDTIFIQEELSYPANYLTERLNSVKSLLFKPNILGMEKFIPPTPRSVMLNITSSVYGEMTYIEDESVTLRSEDISYSFRHAIGENLYPIPHTQSISLIYNFLLMLAFLGLIAFLTTDFEGRANTGNYLNTIPAIIHVAAFIMYSYLVKWFSLYYILELPIQIILYILPVAYLGYWLYIAKIPLKEMGITPYKVIKSLIISFVIFYLLFLSATFELLPSNILDPSSFILTLVLVLLTQIILRGFVQSTLETLLGKWFGLISTSLLISGIFLIDALFLSKASNLLLAFSGYLSISVIVSYSYQRTRNLVTPTILILLLDLFISNLY